MAQHAGAQAWGPPVGVVHSCVVLPDQGAPFGVEVHAQPGAPTLALRALQMLPDKHVLHLIQDGQDRAARSLAALQRLLVAQQQLHVEGVAVLSEGNPGRVRQPLGTAPVVAYSSRRRGPTVNSTHSTLQLGVTDGGAPGAIRVHVGTAPRELGLPVLPAHIAQWLLRDPRVPPGALLTGQPDPEWRAQPSGSLSEEGLGVGVEHVGQAGISALTQQQGVVPAQRLLQQPEGAVEVGELSARGRGRRCWGWAQGGVRGLLADEAVGLLCTALVVPAASEVG